MEINVAGRQLSKNSSQRKVEDKENRSDRHLMFLWLDYTSFLDKALVFFPLCLQFYFCTSERVEGRARVRSSRGENRDPYV